MNKIRIPKNFHKYADNETDDEMDGGARAQHLVRENLTSPAYARRDP